MYFVRVENRSLREEALKLESDLEKPFFLELLLDWEDRCCSANVDGDHTTTKSTPTTANIVQRDIPKVGLLNPQGDSSLLLFRDTE